MRYSKPFLRTSRPAANEQRDAIADGELTAPRGTGRGVRTEAVDVDAVRHGLEPRAVGAKGDGAVREIVAARRHEPGAPERPPRGEARRSEPLGEIDVGAVEADDERKRRRRGGGRHAAGDDPVAVHDRRAMPPRHRPRRAPSGGQRQRGREVGGAPDAHVGPHRGGIAEHVQRPKRRIAVEMKVDALFLGAARDERVPRRHDVDLVAEGRDRTGNRLHEGADAVARESRVRRRHHHDDVGHRVSAARRGAPGATA